MESAIQLSQKSIEVQDLTIGDARHGSPNTEVSTVVTLEVAEQTNRAVAEANHEDLTGVIATRESRTVGVWIEDVGGHTKGGVDPVHRPAGAPAETIAGTRPEATSKFDEHHRVAATVGDSDDGLLGIILEHAAVASSVTPVTK